MACEWEGGLPPRCLIADVPKPVVASPQEDVLLTRDVLQIRVGLEYTIVQQRLLLLKCKQPRYTLPPLAEFTSPPTTLDLRHSCVSSTVRA